jgi:flagellar basal-body rod modification protein FlgD
MAAIQQVSKSAFKQAAKNLSKATIEGGRGQQNNLNFAASLAGASSAVSGGAMNSDATKSDSYGRLVKNDKMANFAIKLITTQLKYQTPIDPVDSKSMLESFLQMFSMEAMNSIKNSFDTWNKQHKSDQLNSASTLLDKRIFYKENSLHLSDSDLTGHKSSLLFLDDNIDLNRKMQLTIMNNDNEIVKQKEISLHNYGYNECKMYDNKQDDMEAGEYAVKVVAFNKQGAKVELPVLKVGNIAQVSRNGESNSAASSSVILHMEDGHQIRDLSEIWALERPANAAGHEDSENSEKM